VDAERRHYPLNDLLGILRVSVYTVVALSLIHTQLIVGIANQRHPSH
jgi:hypothetical protein